LGLPASYDAPQCPFQATSPKGRHVLAIKEFVHFLRNARGSLAEVETQVLIARDLHYIRNTDADQLATEINEISRILVALTSAIQAKIDTDGEA
jgi:hypothetical protein